VKFNWHNAFAAVAIITGIVTLGAAMASNWPLFNPFLVIFTLSSALAAGTYDIYYK
jgi:hypothetical protein